MPEIEVLPGTTLPPLSESSRMKEIQKQHEILIRKSASLTPPSVLEFLDALSQAGAAISDPEYRSQLRDFARYWASVVNNKTGTFPIFQLQPFDESTSSDVRIIGIDDPLTGTRGKPTSSIARYFKAYGASLVSTGIAFPTVASVVIIILYLSSPSLLPIPPSLFSVLFGILLALALWILVAIPFSYFTTARGANSRNYSLLTSRLLELKTRLGVVDDPGGMPELVARKSVNQNTLREAYANYISARNILQNSSSGLLWVSGIGYLKCWILLHRTEEALIEIEPLDMVLRGAIHDKLAIQDSTIGNRDELLDKLMQSVRDLDPSAAELFDSQADSTLKTLIQDLNENKKILNQLVQASKKEGNLEHSYAQEITKDSTLNTEHAQARARTALREVRRTLNDFRDQLWEGLIRSRNQLLLSTAIIGFATLVLLCTAILTSSYAIGRSAMIAATSFYMIGAIAGLFGQLNREAIRIVSIDDYGLSLTRLLVTPLLSGLAGVGGVLIVVVLTGLLEQRSITLGAVFSLNPQYLLVSAAFGLAPTLLIRRLQQRAEKYITDLQASTSAQQEIEETTSRRRRSRETIMQSIDKTEIEGALPTLLISSTPTQEERKGGGSVWNIPYQRNPFFTGREDLLEQLHDHFTQAKTAVLTQPLAITGLGGIGKTQIAIEYAYRYRDDYSTILWVRASTTEELLADMAKIADLLNLSEKNTEDQSIVIGSVKHWLETHTKWLLIFDSADDLAMIRDELPLGDKGHILLTTRAQSMSGFAYKVEVETMESEEGALFLLRRAGFIKPDAIFDSASTTDRALALELVQELDGLPLAIAQAGAYIEETSSSLSGYLTLYRQQRAKLLEWRGGNIFGHPEPIATTWSLAFEKIEQASPAASELLRFCAFLASDAIPEEIFTEGADELGPILQSVTADPFALNLAIRELLNYSFVKRNPEAQQIYIHRLVQAVLKENMDEETQRQWAERTVKAVNSAFPDVEFEAWLRCQRLLPHAQACAALIEQWNFTFPEGARLLNQAGSYLKAHAQYTEALLLYQLALAVSEKALGPDSPDTATILNNLADLYRLQGKYEQAEPLYQRALVIRERVLGSDRPDTAGSLDSLADLYVDQGKYEQAEPLFQRALAIREKVLGPEHPDTATSLNNLAILYANQGKHEEAEPIYQRALAIRRKVLGPDHPDTATSLNNLAILYRLQGKYEQAEPLFQRALAIREYVLGPDHPDTATSLADLAELYQGRGKYEQAEPLFQRALAIREKVLGPEHPDTATILASLAELYQSRGKYEQAEPLFHRAISIYERVFTPDHPKTLLLLENYALLLGKLKRWEQAADIQARAKMRRAGHQI